MAVISENQTQSLILKVTELQHKLSSQPYKISFAKVMTLIRKERDPEYWDGDI